ncbi:hypothetical protein DMJ13_23265 [halophilic archaeon]|nr:hypothetical protein DMJ13_23265 [halophilic archaeon]
MSLDSFRVEDEGPIDTAFCDNVPSIMIVAGPNGVGKSTTFEFIAECMDSNNHSRRGEEIEGSGKPVYLSPHRAPTSAEIDDSIIMQSSSRTFNEALSTQYTLSENHFTSNSLPNFLNAPQSNIERSSREADFAPYYEIKKRLAELKSERERLVTNILDREGKVVSENVPDITEQLSTAVDDLLPGVTFDEIQKEDQTYLIYFENRNGERIEFDNLSSGERDTVALAFPFIDKKLESELAEARNQTVSQEDLVLLIDSPEAYLHPSLQEHFFSYCRREIKEINESKSWDVQLMMCTHSQMILENTPEEELFFLHYYDDIPDEKSNQLISADDLDRDLIETISGDLGFAALSTGKPLLLVEGRSDKKILRKIHRDLDANLEIIPMGSKSSVQGVNKAFNELLPKLSTMGVEVHAIVDRDREWNLDSNIEDRVFILPVTCVENLLLDPSLIYSAIDTLADETEIRSHNLRSASDMSNIINEIIRSDRFKSRELQKRIGDRLSIHIDVTGMEELTEDRIRDRMETTTNTKKDRIGRIISESQERLDRAINEENFGSLNGKIILSFVSDEFNVSQKHLTRYIADKQSPTNLPPKYQDFINKLIN